MVNDTQDNFKCKPSKLWEMPAKTVIHYQSPKMEGMSKWKKELNSGNQFEMSSQGCYILAKTLPKYLIKEPI